jgi:ribosomal protein L12E/L44/L45/RPP1/RPP2
MKTAITALCFMLAAAPAFGQDKAPDTGAKKTLTEKQQKQQARFKDCTERAQGRKGDDRKQFMRGCLKGEQVASAAGAGAQPRAQQGKMKGCSQDASQRSLKGDERKQFMKACLAR